MWNEFELKKDLQSFSYDFLEAVKEICLLANEVGTEIYDGRAENILTSQNINEWVSRSDIFINGSKKQYGQTLALVLDTSFFKWEQTKFCDTKKYPYDCVVKLILQLAYNYGYLVQKPKSENIDWYCVQMWESIEKLLSKTTKSSISVQEFKDFWEK